MKILLYGGTFDPPHYGHLNNLRAAASRVQPDEIVVMPAGVSPFKQMSATPGALRAEMCGCFAEAVQGPRAAARAHRHACLRCCARSRPIKRRKRGCAKTKSTGSKKALLR